MKIGIQLYTVRETLKSEYLGTLESLSKLPGFQGVEFCSMYGGLPPRELADLMERYHWEVSGMFDGFQSFADHESEVYRYAKALKCKCLVSSFSQGALEKDLSGCLSLLEKACAVAAEQGFTVAYHGHPYDHVGHADGGCYLDSIMQVPALQFVPDTVWIVHAGKDVIEVLEPYAGRIPIIHLKDTTADNKVTELGKGIIDLSKIVAFAAANHVEWLDYEQDYFQGDILDGCKTSHDYLQGLSWKGK